ncbi:MAG: hypothetical protein WKG00_06295 [Polyangiaceae bacterium]
MKLSVSIFTAVGVLAALPAIAQAQDQVWLSDRRYTEGIGYRVGDFELHPGLAGEFGYDSNYLHRADEEDPVGTLRLRITPSFSISTIGRQRRDVAPGVEPPVVEFRAGVSATYNEFFDVSGPDIDAGELRGLSGALDISALILSQRPWSFALVGNLNRDIAPSNSGLGDTDFDRVNAKVGGEVIWTPGAGLFDWRLGYNFSGTFFESDAFQGLTHLQHEITTRGRWRFLPRTALMFDGRQGFISYPDPRPNGKTASHPLRARIGLNGLVTKSFGLLALAGYGASFYTPRPQEDFDSIIGQAEVKWYVTPNPSANPMAATLSLSSVALGFTRDFADSYFGTYEEKDRGYLNTSYFFANRFLLVVEGGVAAVVYPPGLELGADPSTDVRIDASVFGELRFADSFGVNGTVRYNANLSDNVLEVTGTGGTVRDSLDYQQFEAYVGFRWFM